MHVKHLAAVAVAALGVALPAAPALAAKPPSSFSLVGENFHATGSDVTITCAAATLSFTATGAASGPYSSTFTETGTATIGTFGLGSLDARFTIYDATRSLTAGTHS
jgi:hypothetical protein